MELLSLRERRLKRRATRTLSGGQLAQFLAEVKELALTVKPMLEAVMGHIPGLNQMIEQISRDKQEIAEKLSDQNLSSLIGSLIPPPVPGHTPTDAELLALIRPLIPKVKDGKTPSDAKLLALIRPLIPPPAKDGETPSDERLIALFRPLIPELDLGEEIIQKINETPDDGPKIDASHIKNLPRLGNRTIFEASNGGGHTIYDESAALTQRTKLKFVGDGVTATDDASADATVVTIATAAGITVETPTGTVNAANDTFTVSAAPQWIVADGVTYFEGAGYSRIGTTILLDVPPSQYIRAFI